MIILPNIEIGQSRVQSPRLIFGGPFHGTRPVFHRLLYLVSEVCYAVWQGHGLQHTRIIAGLDASLQNSKSIQSARVQRVGQSCFDRVLEQLARAIQAAGFGRQWWD